jgi:CubicO group peptidase (beta-lactamase class C family)
MGLCTLLFAIALAGTPVAPFSGQEAAGIDAATVDSTILDEMRATATPGAAVAIVRDGRVVYLKGFGVASVETSDPVTPDTLFRLGSTTKMFTGLAAALLEEEGRLTMAAPIRTVARDLADAVGTLTMHGLLSHTAGVIQEGAGDGSHDDAALARRVRGWDARQIFAPPGDVYSYSSPGYWLAGYVIEVADGKPFADVLADRIFTPAGMSRTTFRPLLALTYPMALDHRVVKGIAEVVRPYPDDVSTWPGGSMFSSARDLARFATAFVDGGRVDSRTVLSPSAITTLSTRKADSLGGCGYTYGLADCEVRGVRTLSHYGFRGGSGSIVRVIPSRRAAIVILANRGGGIMARTEQAVLDMLLPSSPASGRSSSTEPGMRPIAQDEAARLAGRYVNGTDVLTLRAGEGGLTYRYRSEPELPVRQAARDELIVVSPDGQPVQRFVVVKGRITGGLYLSDGTASFRKDE